MAVNRGLSSGTPPWVITGQVIALVFVFLGERVFSSTGWLREALTGIGAVALFTLTGGRWIAARATDGERRSVERALAILSSGSVVAVLVYLTTAEPFDAQGDYLSAGKKLLDTKQPAFKSVTNVRGRAVAYWRGISLPFPEPGIRLILQDDLSAVNVQLTSHKAELDEVVWRLDEHLDELKSAARERLERLVVDIARRRCAGRGLLRRREVQRRAGMLSEALLQAAGRGGRDVVRLQCRVVEIAALEAGQVRDVVVGAEAAMHHGAGERRCFGVRRVMHQVDCVAPHHHALSWRQVAGAKAETRRRVPGVNSVTESL